MLITKRHGGHSLYWNCLETGAPMIMMTEDMKIIYSVITVSTSS